MNGGRLIAVGGARVYVEEWAPESVEGTDAGPGAREPGGPRATGTARPGLDTAAPVLCLHGLGGGTHFFAALGPALGRRVHAVALDFPGSGHSPAPPVLSFDALADVVVELSRQRGWPAVSLIGHSMGTVVALETIRRAPGLVSAFVGVGGLPEPLPTARTRIAVRAADIQRRGMIGTGAAVAAANFSRRTQRERPELVGLFAKLFERQDPAGYCATADMLARWTARELPPLTKIPCLLVTGEEDAYAPPDAVDDFRRALPRGTRVEVMPDCGHLPFLEQPDACAALVTSFLSGIPPA